MIDWTQRGNASTHRYRGYYDAGEQSTTHCAQCNHVIRFCYSLHDKNMKSFVIGTCCFQNYIGTKTLVQLEAAKELQSATKAAIIHDTKLYGALTGIRERRKQWLVARRNALRILRAYRKVHGAWLPKELFELNTTAVQVPREYKRRFRALKWYENATSKLAAQTVEAEYAIISSPDLR